MYSILGLVLLAVVVTAQRGRSDLSGVNTLAFEAKTTFCDAKASDQTKTTRWNECFVKKIPQYFISFMEDCASTLNLKMNETEFLIQICNVPAAKNQYAGCLYNKILSPPSPDFMTKIANVGPNDIPNINRNKRGIFDWLTGGGSTSDQPEGTDQPTNQGDSGFNIEQATNDTDVPDVTHAEKKKRWIAPPPYTPQRFNPADYNMPNFKVIAQSGVQVPQDSLMVKFASQALQNCQKQYPS